MNSTKLIIIAIEVVIISTISSMLLTDSRSFLEYTIVLLIFWSIFLVIKITGARMTKSNTLITGVQLMNMGVLSALSLFPILDYRDRIDYSYLLFTPLMILSSILFMVLLLREKIDNQARTRKSTLYIILGYSAIIGILIWSSVSDFSYSWIVIHIPSMILISVLFLAILFYKFLYHRHIVENILQRYYLIIGSYAIISALLLYGPLRGVGFLQTVVPLMGFNIAFLVLLSIHTFIQSIDTYKTALTIARNILYGVCVVFTGVAIYFWITWVDRF